jgi:hypothetical protein
MSLKLFFVILLLNISANSFSQSQEEYQKFIDDSIKITISKPVRPQFKFDTRTTVYEGQKVNMFGYDAGVLVKDKLRLTLGYYRIDDQLPKHTEINLMEVRQSLFVRCGTINSELIYLQQRFFSLGFPLEVGLGYYRLKNISVLSGSEASRLEGIVAFSNFGLAGTFTPIRWFGLKAIVGYRKAVLSSNKQFDFNGIFSSIGLNMDMQEIVKDIKMYRLKKKYYKGNFKGLESFTDLMID